MNLYFRLIRLYFIALFRKGQRTAYTEPTKLNFRVLPLDMDINLHMNNARYLSMMDLGRINHMSSCGLMSIIMKKRLMPVVAKLDIRYIKPLDAFESYTLQTEITSHDEKYFYITQTFIKGGKHAAVAHVKGLFLNKNGKKIPSEEILELLANSK